MDPITPNIPIFSPSIEPEEAIPINCSSTVEPLPSKLPVKGAEAVPTGFQLCARLSVTHSATIFIFSFSL